MSKRKNSSQFLNAIRRVVWYRLWKINKIRNVIMQLAKRVEVVTLLSGKKDAPARILTTRKAYRKHRIYSCVVHGISCPTKLNAHAPTKSPCLAIFCLKQISLQIFHKKYWYWLISWKESSRNAKCHVPMLQMRIRRTKTKSQKLQ